MRLALTFSAFRFLLGLLFCPNKSEYTPVSVLNKRWLRKKHNPHFIVSWESHHCACTQGVLAMIICPLTFPFPQHPHCPQHLQYGRLITVVHPHGWLEVNELEASKERTGKHVLGNTSGSAFCVAPSSHQDLR